MENERRDEKDIILERVFCLQTGKVFFSFSNIGVTRTLRQTSVIYEKNERA